MKKNQLLVLSLLFFCMSNAVVANQKEPKSILSKKDINYLKDVYRDTFSCLEYFVNENTGLPYDVSDLRKETSISNIGLYLASVAVAYKTGLLKKEEAVEKINKTFASLKKIKKWHGFPITWVNVDTLERGFGPSFSYGDHVGNLVSSLLVVEGAFPDVFADDINSFIAQMDFASTYEAKKGWIKGGFNLQINDFDVKQQWGDWYYNIYASDVRHYSLLAITLGQIPEKHWSMLNRDTSPFGPIDKEFQNKYPGLKYYYPGMEGGGIFMQYLPGIFLNEKNLPIRNSARNLADAQIRYSKNNKYYPFWGVSASESPDGKTYYGWAGLKMNIVTPHGSVLAIEDFPKDTVKNLRALEKNNMRPVLKISGKEYKFGFTDAYDIETRASSKNYLMFDQAMLFLSMANFLHDNIVRKCFSDSGLGNKAMIMLNKLESQSK